MRQNWLWDILCSPRFKKLTTYQFVRGGGNPLFWHLTPNSLPSCCCWGSNLSIIYIVLCRRYRRRVLIWDLGVKEGGKKSMMLSTFNVIHPHYALLYFLKYRRTSLRAVRAGAPFLIISILLGKVRLRAPHPMYVRTYARAGQRTNQTPCLLSGGSYLLSLNGDQFSATVDIGDGIRSPVNGRHPKWRP